jgi:uncharacterized caspase-like protein
MYRFLPILLFAYALAITTDDIYDNSYALIIGIDKYENVKNLNYAVADAESIQDILVNTFNFPEGNVTLLKNEEANKDAILKAFSDLTKKAEDNDRVLIYFAGHGETMELIEGGERGYLLPVDGNEDLYLSSIGMDELEKLSEMSRAKHMLYLVDACYGGLAAISSRGSRGLDVTSTPNYIEKITRNRAVQIIAAGGKDEEVQEKAKWGASAFTLNLKRGLKEGNADLDADGYITANELGLFLKTKVTIDSDNQQTPQYGRMTSQEGEFVFVLSEDTVVIQDKSADAKLDYLISEMEELKTQSTVDKTRPDFMVNPEMQQSDYPLIISAMWADYALFSGVKKQLDKRSVVGIGFQHQSKRKTWAGENLDYTSIEATPFVGYYLTPRKTKIFNPLIILGISFNMEKWNVETLQLNDTGTELNYSLGLHNYIVVNQDFGFSIGLGGSWYGKQEFDDYGGLYVDRHEFTLYPIFYLDFTIPNINYEALSSSDKITHLRQQKKADLIGFSIAYGSPIVSMYWLSDGINIPVLLIPVIGPFLSLSYDKIDREYKNITLFSGIGQTYLLFDYIRTSRKIKELNKNISYQINPNPIAPSVKFTYNFD